MTRTSAPNVRLGMGPAGNSMPRSTTDRNRGPASRPKRSLTGVETASDEGNRESPTTAPQNEPKPPSS
eukprot:6854595-Pyramimonas_sp.AAC.1